MPRQRPPNTGRRFPMSDANDTTTSTGELSFSGSEAIEYAIRTGARLWKAADPTEGARVVSLAEAEEIVRQDPSLITVPIEIDPGPADRLDQLISLHGRTTCVTTGRTQTLRLQAARAGDAELLRICDVALGYTPPGSPGPITRTRAILQVAAALIEADEA